MSGGFGRYLEERLEDPEFADAFFQALTDINLETGLQESFDRRGR